MSSLTWDGAAEPVSRDHILMRKRGQGNIHLPCSAHHEQDWKPYPVDPYFAVSNEYAYYSEAARLSTTPLARRL